MPESVVIDTNIILFGVGSDANQEEFEDSWYIVSETFLSEEYLIGIDNEGEILEEYRENLSDVRNPQAQMVEEAVKREIRMPSDDRKFRTVVPLPTSQVDELIEMGFDSDDIKFVRIAPNTDSEIITSADTRSFLVSEYREWIEDELEVEIMPPDEFRSYLDET